MGEESLERPAPPDRPEAEAEREELHALGAARELPAERRARQAAESAEAASTRRAEAAEATVWTLEAHVAALRRRLHEPAEEESDRQAPRPRLVIEREPSGVGQRDDADRRRLLAESRWLDLHRRNRDEIERLNRRLSDSQRDACGLAQRLEGVQRELASCESVLARMRRGHRRLADILAELRTVMSRLSGLIAEAGRDVAPEPFETQLSEARIRAYRLGPPNRGSEPKRATDGGSAAVSAEDGPRDPRARELDSALAVAVERLRARAAAGDGLEGGAEAGSPQSSGIPVSMSPSREPLLARRRPSWWAAWWARRRARRQR
jgi:hypothetical protein